MEGGDPNVPFHWHGVGLISVTDRHPLRLECVWPGQVFRERPGSAKVLPGQSPANRALATATLCIVPCAKVGRVGAGPARNASACKPRRHINVPGSAVDEGWGALTNVGRLVPGPAGARGLRKGSMFPGRSRELKAGAGGSLCGRGGRNNSPQSQRARRGGIASFQRETLTQALHCTQFVS